MAQKRMIPCPCTVKVKVNRVKKTVTTQEGFFAWIPFGIQISSLAEAASDLIGIGKRVPSYEIIEADGSKCPACNGKREIEDATDTTADDQARADAAKAAEQQIVEAESGIGQVGGNKIGIVVGNVFQQIGLEFNDSPSYEVIAEGTPRQSGVTLKEEGVAPIYTKSAQVVGKNPLATIGGQYFLNVANKYSLQAGAQGIDLITKGPLTIGAGITRITAPEISIGSSVGPVSLEGESVNIGGKNIVLTPDPAGRGQVSVQGTLSTNGNLVTQGGAHIEGDLSFISATAPMKIERTRFASDVNQVTGAAQWSTIASTAALQDFTRKWGLFATDPSAYLASPRGVVAFVSDVINLTKKALPIEPYPTGIVVTVGSSLLVYNFPHHHVLSDGAHCHDMQVPNINLMNSSEEVRQLASAKEAIAPVAASSPKKNILVAVFDTLKALAAFYTNKA